MGVSIVFPPDTDTPQLHEENKTKPAETKAIAGTVKVLQPEDVARAIAEGIAAGRYHIVPGLGNKFSYFMYRHFPWAVRYVIDNDLKRPNRVASEAASARHSPRLLGIDAETIQGRRGAIVTLFSGNSAKTSR